MTNFRLTAREATRRIHETAKKTEDVIFGTHALDRMEERSITDAQVYEVLRSGDVLEAPALTKRREWQCKVIKQLRGGRSVGVITIILRTGKLFVKTVEWEDIR
ncbi:MAG TPA: DUF4258 domain-containing protein [Xanthobacteraceae bacterium]|nr:DUF4258 domain-containing protein [Xanthobacteraceae bacterium]